MTENKTKYAPQARYAEKLKARTKMYRFRLYTDKDADIIEFLENYSGMASRFIKEAIREKMRKKK